MLLSSSSLTGEREAPPRPLLCFSCERLSFLGSFLDGSGASSSSSSLTTLTKAERLFSEVGCSRSSSSTLEPIDSLLELLAVRYSLALLVVRLFCFLESVSRFRPSSSATTLELLELLLEAARSSLPGLGGRFLFLEGFSRSRPSFSCLDLFEGPGSTWSSSSPPRPREELLGAFWEAFPSSFTLEFSWASTVLFKQAFFSTALLKIFHKTQEQNSKL